MKREAKVAQLCPTLCNPMDYTVHGILQASILEWVAFPFSRGSSQSRDGTQVSCIADGFFTSWATREALLAFKVPAIRAIYCDKQSISSSVERIVHGPITASSLITKQKRRTKGWLATWSFSHLASSFAREFLLQFTVNKNASHTLP